jgi:hypothetical protein
MGDWTHVGFLMNSMTEEDEPNTVVEMPSTDVPPPEAAVPSIPPLGESERLPAAAMSSLSLTMCCVFGMACLAYMWYKK